MKKLGYRNYILMFGAIKICGTFNPDEIMPYFEERLYVHEADTVWAFLEWVHADEVNRSFDRMNYEERFKEFNLDSSK